MNLAALLLALGYRLRHHRWGPWSLAGWGVTLPLLVSTVVLLRWIANGRPTLPAWHWGLLALLIAFAIVWYLHGRRAQRRMYVIFQPETGAAPPAPSRLAPDDKIWVRVTGRFGVAGKSQFLADLLAYWRTFATREHAIMAIVRRTRFLLVGAVPEQNVGMWYIFFTPETVEAITPGVLTHGRHPRPGLLIAYRHTTAAEGQRKPPKPETRVVFLGFEDAPARDRVWADLLVETATV